MKKLTTICSTALLILFLIMLSIGCQATPPLASFAADKVSGGASLLVNFTNTSQNADKFQWDFGDGTTKTTTTIGESVSHDYTKAGTYIVTLTVIKEDDTSQTATMNLIITVTYGLMDNVTVDPGSVVLDIGQTQEFTTEILDAYGNPVPDAQITWEVVATAGTISHQGILTAGTEAGTYNDAVTVTARLSNLYTEDMASVTIMPDPLDIVKISSINVAAGETNQLEFTTTDQYGNLLDDVDVSWSVTDENAGSITSQGFFTAGEVVGDFADVVVANAMQDGASRTVTASVKISAGPLEQVVIAPDPTELGMGMTQQFVAVGVDQYGNRISDLSFNWSVQNGGGTIDTNGLFTAGTSPDTYNDTVQAQATHGGITQSGTVDVIVEPDRIAFLSNRDLDDEDAFELYIMDVDGDNQERLISGIVNVGKYSFSPDGRRIMFGVDGDILAYSSDGTWGMAVLSGREAFEPNWSFDGSKIAFQSWEHDPSEIYSMDIDGGNLTRLTDNSNYDDYPVWSPDGTKIAFLSVRGGVRAIWVMNADGSNQRRLTADIPVALWPAWSPDGTEIMFQSDRARTRGIDIMNADGSNLRQISPTDFSSNCPAWSPDSTQIVFHGFQHTDEGEIYIMDRDGTNIARLTNNSSMDYIPVYLPRKAGIEVSEASVIIPDTSTLEPMTVQEVTARARKAVVRIETDIAGGSGFIIEPDGLIITNNHVVSDAEEITVYLEDGTEYTATVKGRDLVRDLALIKIQATGLPYLEIGDLSGVDLGQQIIVLGYPGTESVTVTSGLVSVIDFDSGRNITWIQTDSAVNPGNSGGPMLDLWGRVIGIIATKIMHIAVEGQGFAISTNTMYIYIERLKDDEIITQ